MRSGKRRQSKSVVKKSPAYNPITDRGLFESSVQRIRPGVDYTRMRPDEVRRISQERLDKWKNYTPPPSLQNSPAFQNQQRVALARRKSEAISPPVNVNQSTPGSGSRVSLNTSVAVSTLSRVSPLAVPSKKKGNNLLECVGRKLRRQFIFATGGNGQRRRIVKQRASPSKVRC